MLTIDEKKWGPRPWRILKCMKILPGYFEGSMEFFSGGILERICIEKKFKLIKERLENWHLHPTENLEGRTKGVKDHMSILDGCLFIFITLSFDLYFIIQIYFILSPSWS